MPFTIRRTVIAKLDDGTQATMDFGMGPGVLGKDELHYKEDYDALSDADKSALAVDLIRRNDELLETLFEVKTEVL